MKSVAKTSKIKAVISELKANREKHGVTNQAEYDKFRMHGRNASTEAFILKMKNADKRSDSD